jgi:hypothetical protein
MSLTEIEALADAATHEYLALDSEKYLEQMKDIHRFHTTMNPQTVKAMCQLIRQQHEAIYGGLKDHADGFGIETAVFRSALAAYEEFNK